MPIFKPISENEAKGKVKEIFEEIKTERQLSEVPKFWKSIENNNEKIHNIINVAEEIFVSLKNNNKNIYTNIKISFVIVNKL